MAKTISIANQKGGVGKTTTTVNMGAVLSFVYNKKILLIDLDAQGNSGDHLGIDVSSKPTVYDLMDGTANIEDSIHTYEQGFDIIASDITLASADREFVSLGSEYMIKKIIAKISKNYDYILIDCPPSLGILTINAFTASDELIIPIEPAVFSVKGLIELNRTIESVQEFTNDKLVKRGAIFTEFNERFNINKTMKETVDQIIEVLNIPIFSTYTRRSVVVSEAQAVGKDLISYGSASTTEDDYRAIVKEYLEMEGETYE